MKNYLYATLVVLLVAAMGAVAGMDDVIKTVSPTGNGVAITNSYVIHGEVESVRIWASSPASGVTGALVVTSSDSVTVGSLSTTNSKIAYPRIAVTSTSGTQIGTYTNTNTKIPISGKITLVVTQDGVGTNEFKTKIVYKD